MNTQRLLAPVVALVALIVVPLHAQSLKLPALFTDHMVLQRDLAVPVWGWAAPNAEVTVTAAGQTKTATADADGKWVVKLDPLSTGEPIELSVTSGGETKKLGDVLVGEVWVCSGQSNMEWPLNRTDNAQEAIAAADHPQIRLFTVTKKIAQEPVSDVEGAWEVCSPQTVSGFSAVGYYFGRKLNTELNVPVGLIDSSWGGTPSQAWTSREKLLATPEAVPIVERFDKAMADYPAAREAWLKRVEEWEKGPQAKPQYHSDPGNTGEANGFASTGFDDSAWETDALPGEFDQEGVPFDGAVWYRKTVEIPEAWAGQPMVVALGPIDDFDVTYLNGEVIGKSSLEASAYSQPRRYEVPPAQVKAGPATIAVRVFDHFGGGGFAGTPAQMFLSSATGGDTIPLDGDWKMFVEHRLDPSAVTGPSGNAPGRPREPMGPNNPHGAGVLYNGMIAPLIPYAIRGATWYQGESNAGLAEQYRTIFPAMITDWRERWGQGDFPFLFVQLANYMATSAEPSDTAWAHLRDAQLHTLKTVPNTGMAVIIDIGQADDIHPTNKKDVGERLARWALADTYGKSDVVKSGPLLADANVSGGEIVLTFDHVGTGLKTRDGGPVKGFAAAPKDGPFQWAEATIVSENQVAITLPAGVEPADVRYAWADNPAEANLVNSEGLPASPFRTDTRPGPTDGKR